MCVTTYYDMIELRDRYTIFGAESSLSFSRLDGLDDRTHDSNYDSFLVCHRLIDNSMNVMELLMP